MADYLDHAFSQRLGQRTAHTPANILRVTNNAARPTNASHGQVVYAEDSGSSYIWNQELLGDDQDPGDEPAGNWEPFGGGGGGEFYAQPEPPASAGYGAFWLDTAP